MKLNFQMNMHKMAITLAFSMSFVVLNAQNKAVVYVTAKEQKLQLQQQSELTLSPLEQPQEWVPTIILDSKKQFQSIIGFGGALTDASAETIYKLPTDKQEEIINAYFSDNGIGYTLCRTHIHSCDFSSESYAYTEVPGDVKLKHFSIKHDLKYRIPLIKRALAASSNKLQLFASPWSPPAWMKTNNNMLLGGQIKPEYKQAWADYYVRFLEEYQKQGITFWGLTIQNEPHSVQTWESCVYTAEEERDFLKNYLGPTIKSSRFSNTNIICWDHNRGLMYQRAKVMYEDPEAAKYLWGTGFHWYTGNHFENVGMVHDAFPDKHLLFTEGCHYPFDSTKVKDWKWGELYAESMIHDLNNWTEGWVDWNIVLDENGGPNHVGNFCYSPIIANTKTGELTYMNSYYYLGHFSKFIRPEAKRIACTSNDDRLIATAFMNTDGSVPVVVLNQNDEAIDFQVWINNKICTYKAPAHSILTLILLN